MDKRIIIASIIALIIGILIGAFFVLSISKPQISQNNLQNSQNNCGAGYENICIPFNYLHTAYDPSTTSVISCDLTRGYNAVCALKGHPSIYQGSGTDTQTCAPTQSVAVCQ